jgi:hypothetical protein
MKALQVTGGRGRTAVNEFLVANHYLGRLPVWKAALALPGGPEGSWRGVVVLGSPCSRVYGKSYLEVRRIALVPGEGAEAARDLVRAAQSWAAYHGFSRLLAYADPNVPEGRNCPGNTDFGLWTGAGFEQIGWTRPRKSTEKGSNRRVMDGSRARFLWSVA